MFSSNQAFDIANSENTERYFAIIFEYRVFYSLLLAK